MTGINRILIEQQYATIGVNVTPAQMNITMPRMQMTVESQTPQMTVERQMPQFKVNWTKVRSESGLKTPSEVSKDISFEARKAVGDFMTNSADDSNYISSVDKPGNRIAQVYRRKSLSQDRVEVNIGTMPQSLPEVEWTPGSIDVSWSDHQLEVSWEGTCMPEVVIDPPFSIEIYLRDKPYIRIVVEDGVTMGEFVDRTL